MLNCLRNLYIKREPNEFNKLLINSDDNKMLHL